MEADNPEVTAADRRCREHRPGLGRAWCYDDGEWCYENEPCRGCTIVALQAQLDALHGMRFSDRSYHALKSRAETAEARATALEDLVRRMRDAQRRYYKTRDKAVLIESKGLEREVDRALGGTHAAL